MTKRRGFASMDSAKQREIASKGGKAAHQKGTAHQFTQEEAREAGRKGGQAAHFKGTAHKFTSEEARAAGRKGGRSARNSPVMPSVTSTPPAPESEEQLETPPTNTNGPFGSGSPPPINGSASYAPGAMPIANPTPSGSSA